MDENDLENNSWIKYILSGLVAIFFALLGIQMRAQENIDAIQDRQISEMKDVLKEQEKSLMYFRMLFDQRFSKNQDP